MQLNSVTFYCSYDVVAVARRFLEQGEKESFLAQPSNPDAFDFSRPIESVTTASVSRPPIHFLSGNGGRRENGSKKATSESVAMSGKATTTYESAWDWRGELSAATPPAND